MLDSKAIPFGAVVLVVLLVASAGVAGATVSAPVGQVGAGDDDTETAKAVYLHENGDAVLVFDGDTNSQETKVDLDMTEGLGYMTASEEMPSATGFTAELTTVLTGSQLFLTGSGSTQAPEALSSLDFSLTGEQSASTSTMDMALDAKLSGGLAAIGAGETSGSVTVGANEITSQGSLTARVPLPNMESADVSFSLSESDGTYTVNVDTVRTVYAPDDWDTRAKAKSQLQSQYSAQAEQLGGSATVTVQEYEFTEDEDGFVSKADVDLKYEVVFEGVESGLVDEYADGLADSEELGLSQSEAEDVAEQLLAIEFEEVSFSASGSQGRYEAEWTVDIQNVKSALQGVSTVLGSIETDEEGAQQSVEEAKAYVDALVASELSQTLTWEASLTQSADAATLSAEASMSTSNWGAYVDELQRQGHDIGYLAYAANAQTVDGQIESEFEVDLQRAQLVGQAVDAFQQAAEADEDFGEEDRREFQRLLQAEFDRAKLTMTMGGGTFDMTGGLAASNVSALQPLFQEAYGGEVTSIVSRPAGEGEFGFTRSENYVRVPGLVSSDAAESDVRDLEVVGPETEVHMPGTWDREFPTVRTDEAADFLEVSDELPEKKIEVDEGDGGDGTTTAGDGDDTTGDGDGTTAGDGDGTTGDGDGTDDTGGDSGGVPGFTPVTAMLALLGAALLAARRY